jgi:hypothetical protein
MSTAMQQEIRDSDGCDRGTRDYFIKMKEEGTAVCPDESARRCIDLVFVGGGDHWLTGMENPVEITEKFVSGAHVDYYDLDDKEEEEEKEGEGEGEVVAE